MAVIKVKKEDGTWEIVSPINNEIRHTAQSLTEEQKAQARQNIGVPDVVPITTDEIDAMFD